MQTESWGAALSKAWSWMVLYVLDILYSTSCEHIDSRLVMLFSLPSDRLTDWQIWVGLLYISTLCNHANWWISCYWPRECNSSSPFHKVPSLSVAGERMCINHAPLNLVSTFDICHWAVVFTLIHTKCISPAPARHVSDAKSEFTSAEWTSSFSP